MAVAKCSRMMATIYALFVEQPSSHRATALRLLRVLSQAGKSVAALALPRPNTPILVGMLIGHLGDNNAKIGNQRRAPVTGVAGSGSNTAVTAGDGNGGGDGEGEGDGEGSVEWEPSERTELLAIVSIALRYDTMYDEFNALYPHLIQTLRSIIGTIIKEAGTLSPNTACAAPAEAAPATAISAVTDIGSGGLPPTAVGADSYAAAREVISLLHAAVGFSTRFPILIPTDTLLHLRPVITEYAKHLASATTAAASVGQLDLFAACLGLVQSFFVAAGVEDATVPSAPSSGAAADSGAGKGLSKETTLLAETDEAERCFSTILEPWLAANTTQLFNAVVEIKPAVEAGQNTPYRFRFHPSLLQGAASAGSAEAVTRQSRVNCLLAAAKLAKTLVSTHRGLAVRIAPLLLETNAVRAYIRASGALPDPVQRHDISLYRRCGDQLLGCALLELAYRASIAQTDRRSDYETLAGALARQLPAGFESKVLWLLRNYVFAPSLYNDAAVTASASTSSGVGALINKSTPGAAFAAYARTVFKNGPLKARFVETSASRDAALIGGRTSLLLPARTQGGERLFLPADWSYLPLREFGSRAKAADLAAVPVPGADAGSLRSETLAILGFITFIEHFRQGHVAHLDAGIRLSRILHVFCLGYDVYSDAAVEKCLLALWNMLAAGEFSKTLQVNEREGRRLLFVYQDVLAEYVTSPLPPSTSFFVNSRTLMGSSTPHQCPLESVASYLCHFMLTFGCTFR